ncbi:hypothetical protein PbB2_02748 [Candidatus Phycosocius bacilliformis]|uniref:Uncharacterized protein n=1 Tax=Candidatus Phycosocius bacilliformis TaxID=1445552 RepID=A0A2P2EDB7_9PROT|nr:hypothetical protein PbB2_02748 [Candidatus Phycosocius bacilliformis]
MFQMICQQRPTCGRQCKVPQTIQTAETDENNQCNHFMLGGLEQRTGRSHQEGENQSIAEQQDEVDGLWHSFRHQCWQQIHTQRRTENVRFTANLIVKWPRILHKIIEDRISDLPVRICKKEPTFSTKYQKAKSQHITNDKAMQGYLAFGGFRGQFFQSKPTGHQERQTNQSGRNRYGLA